MEDELQKQYAEALARGQTGNAKQEKLSKNPKVNKMPEFAANGSASAPSVPVSSLLNAKPADAMKAVDVGI
ncbi:hypothetical protein E4T56_gene3178 [Termitomyces sp. T112]|nr:hypothetical protein E4T56_gene3178 [Termitomyces sp. T112]